MKSIDFVRLDKGDNLLVLPYGGEAGDVAGGVRLTEAVPAGHKVACTRIAKGDCVRKYGHAIGMARIDIPAGAWVHEHNLGTRFVTGAGCSLRWPGVKASATRVVVRSDRTFPGYPRPGGAPGIRNDLWIIPTVGCLNGELRSVLASYHKPYWIDAVRLLEHSCCFSQTGWDLDATTAILAGLAVNPNAAGVLLVGLGGENLSASDLLGRILRNGASRGAKHVRMLELQDAEAPEIGTILDELANGAPRTRVCFPLSELFVGVLCGEGGCSEPAANPLLGRFADWLTTAGGTILAAEIPELFGAEDVIAARIADGKVFEDFVALDGSFRAYFERYGQPVLETPSPEERAGGLTTREEKSLGVLEKTGRAPVTRVLRYGETVGKGGGVQLTFSPGDDPIAATSLVGAGAQAILFATGQGTPFGSVVPTVKIAAGSLLAERHPAWIDFDAGPILEGESWEGASARLAEYVLRAASGERTANERRNVGDIAIFRDGVIL